MTQPDCDSWYLASFRWLVIWLVAVSCPSACGPQPLTVTREPVTLRIAAAKSCGRVLEDAAEAYETSRPWVSLQAEALNNALAVEALLEDRVDVALLSWRLTGEEISEALWVEPFAHDGIAIVVHPASSFSAIGMPQLRDLFGGRLQEWEGMVVTVLSREAGSGTRAAFEHIVLSGDETSLNAVVLPSAEAMMDYVASHAAAIGYVSTRCLDERVRALPVEGVAPTEDAVTEGIYPVRRELLVATHGEPVGEARQFAQWLLRVGASDDWDEVSVTP